MPRPPKPSEDEVLDIVTDAEPKPGNGDAVAPTTDNKPAKMSVQLSGSPDAVQRAAGRLSDKPQPASEAKESGTKESFLRALGNPKLVVRVKRISPRFIERDGKRVPMNFEVYSERAPLNYHDIQEEVGMIAGGRKFRITITNDKGEIVEADNFDVDRDPVMPEDQSQSDADLTRQLMELNQPNAVEMTATELENELKLEKKRFDVERQRDELEELRSRRKSGQRDPALETKIAELERQVIESKLRAEYEAKLADERRAREEQQRQLDELKRRVEAPKEGQSELGRVLDTMLKQQEKSDARFTELLKEMRDQREQTRNDAILAKLTEIGNKPKQEGNAIKDALEIVKEIRALDKDDGDDDPDDDPEKPWYERLADRYLPKVFDLIEERARNGRPMTDAEIAAEFARARQQAQTAQPLPARTQVPALPAPVPMAPPAPSPLNPGVATPEPSPVPQPIVVPQAPTPPSPVASPQPTVEEQLQAALPTVEKEIADRAEGIAVIIEREARIRAHEYEWPLIAWERLPEELRERMAKSVSPLQMLAVLKERIPNPARIDDLMNRLQSDVKLAKWIERGWKELVEWGAKLEKDPNFDPTDEENPE